MRVRHSGVFTCVSVRAALAAPAFDVHAAARSAARRAPEEVIRMAKKKATKKKGTKKKAAKKKK
jgi:hypothetical protein